MQKNFSPKENYEKTRRLIGYIPLNKATQSDYDRIGFMSGLEVHQQLLTKEKLFCRCPAGVFQKGDEHDAELIRHMRPTLSELGEYDGTALMEFKTKKNIVYHIKNETACTYDVDDTPPFPINREALGIAIEISLLSKLNIVGEVHITRKQYLDGSIPTGFQRTAIIGVEGQIPLKNKTVRLIQLSIEEDSCREISDIGHVRVYKTDRLGMPLIETVTYPDCENPYEVAEACNYIRFLNRSTGKVRTGIGAARQDVNVSCAGGTRVEIKGVSHIKWIPKLTHNEAFRQWALLSICKLLTDRVAKPAEWKLTWEFVDKKLIHVPMVPKRGKDKFKVIAVNLPHFHGVLSHFLQPGKMFADELADRIKVIACIEKPNLLHSEEIEPQFPEIQWNNVKTMLKAGDSDSQLIIWGPEADLVTAVETIEERCKMAFAGVPKETRKSFPDGTTIFERVLPGADRMYPDTDSAPIPLPDAYINELAKKLPPDVIEQYVQLREWQVPEDTYTFIFKKNLFPVIKKIVTELEISPKYIGSFFGHTVKNIDGHHAGAVEFNYYLVFELFKYLRDEKLGFALARKMLPVLYLHPKIDFNSILMGLNFKPTEKAEILTRIEFLKRVFNAHGRSKDPEAEANWLMGQVRKIAEGNVDLHELRQLL